MNGTIEPNQPIIVVPDSSFSETQKRLMLKRCPNIWTYATPQTNNMSPDETERYNALNTGLHEQLAATFEDHFARHPIPNYYLDKNDPWLAERKKYDFYTHQNWDWFGPSQECYAAILTNEITMPLLRRLQLLLVDAYADWEIVVIASDDHRMDHGPEIAVFSDTILIPKSMDHLTSSKETHRTTE